MKKLALKLDSLQVETFTTDEQQLTRKGTVRGHYGTTHTQAGQTCDYSCGGTCDDDTCQYTCTQTALYTYCNGVECY